MPLQGSFTIHIPSYKIFLENQNVYVLPVFSIFASRKIFLSIGQILCWGKRDFVSMRTQCLVFVCLQSGVTPFPPPSHAGRTQMRSLCVHKFCVKILFICALQKTECRRTATIFPTPQSIIMLPMHIYVVCMEMRPCSHSNLYGRSF